MTATQSDLDAVKAWIEAMAETHAAVARGLAEEFVLRGFSLGPSEWSEISAQIHSVIAELTDKRHRFDLTDQVQAINRATMLQLYTLSAEAAFLKRIRDLRAMPAEGRA